MSNYWYRSPSPLLNFWWNHPLECRFEFAISPNFFPNWVRGKGWGVPCGGIINSIFIWNVKTKCNFHIVKYLLLPTLKFLNSFIWMHNIFYPLPSKTGFQPENTPIHLTWFFLSILSLWSGHRLDTYVFPNFISV